MSRIVFADHSIGTRRMHAAGSLQIAVIFAAITVVGVGALSPQALLTSLTNLSFALLVLGPPVVFGHLLVPLLPLGPMPSCWRWLLAAALGIGFACLLVLVLGLAAIGLRGIWWLVIGAAVVVGGWRIVRWALRRASGAGPRASSVVGETDGSLAHLWLVAVPFAVFALLAAANPPGVLWREEGFGYDILEYHLQVPKEYWQLGRIAYLPHNVYANFPSNVELLYLLNMVIRGNAVDSATTANMIHALLGGLFVLAAWVAGRSWSRSAATIAGVSAATLGWLVYLSGLAYVECGMLFFSMTATAAALRAVHVSDSAGSLSRRQRLSWLAVAGVCAGLACGCKYTAVPMVALPLAAAGLLLPQANTRTRILAVAFFLLGVGSTLSPWLVKNVVLTGNPVFPLANDVFNAQPPGWGNAQDIRWQRGHAPVEAEQPFGKRLAVFQHRVLNDRYQRIGPALFVLALAAVALSKRRDACYWMLVILLVVQIFVWLFATHLLARFAIPLLVPLILLGARWSAEYARARAFAVVAVLVGAVFNAFFCLLLVQEESRPDIQPSAFYRGTLVSYGWEFLSAVNESLPQNAHLLLVAEARPLYFKRSLDYTVVFNRQPFAEAVRAGADLPTWFHTQGYTHVLVNWSELARLQQTYGFDPEINWQLFSRLCDAGLLAPYRSFTRPGGDHLHVTIFTVAR